VQQSCGPKHNRKFQGGCGNDNGIVRTTISSILLWHNDTSSYTPNWRTKDLRYSVHTLDLFSGMLHENIIGICVKQSKAQGEYGRRTCNRRGIRFLHWIFARLYNHKAKGMGW